MHEMNQAGQPLPRHEHRLPAEGIALLTSLVLSLLGIAVTDYSPTRSRHYWAIMTLVLALSGMVIGSARARRSGRPIGEYLVIQTVHWAATGVAVAGVFLLLRSGRLNYENTGLVLLLLLGLSTFLDGFRVSWHFSLIGVLMFLAAIVSGFVEQYIWVLLIVAVATAVAVITWERRKVTRLASAPGRSAPETAVPELDSEG